MTEQDGLFAKASAEPTEPVQDAESVAATFQQLDHFLQRSWRAAEKMLGGDSPDGLFALGRAYYAVYNGCILAAIALGIPRDRYREGSQHHEEHDAVFHSRLPVLASDICKALEPPKTLRGTTSRAEQTFALVRELQKYRKRADYMGLETVSVETARRCIEEAKRFVTWVWEKVREHFGIKPGASGATGAA